MLSRSIGRKISLLVEQDDEIDLGDLPQETDRHHSQVQGAAFYRLRYTVIQALMPSYRFRHCRLIHYITYFVNSCRQNVLLDDILLLLVFNQQYGKGIGLVDLLTSSTVKV